MYKHFIRLVFPLLLLGVVFFSTIAAVQPPRHPWQDHLSPPQQKVYSLLSTANNPLEFAAVATTTVLCNPTGQTEWHYSCLNQRVEITGIGMGDETAATNPQTISLIDPAKVSWLLAQVAGRYGYQALIPERVTFTTDSSELLTLDQPASSNTEGYTFEADLQPTSEITALVDNPGGSYKTPRGLILYTKREVIVPWTSIGKTISSFVYHNAYSEVVTFPPLTKTTDLYITAVIIDNQDDNRPFVLEAKAGDRVTQTLPITGPTDGSLLNIVPLTLTAVPKNTDLVTITLYSPTDNGDSLVWVGMNVSYQCGDEPKADLAVTKMVNNPTPNAGDTITYTVVVTNNGPNDATGVQISDTMPSGLTLSRVTTTQGVYTNNLWTVGTINAGSSARLMIAASIDSNRQGQTITNTASLLSSEPLDADPTNNVGKAVIRVRDIIGADLAVTKTVNNPAPDGGEVIIYTVTVTNNGPDDATGVQIRDKIPEGTTFISYMATAGTIYTSATGLWNVGNLLDGASAILTITARVNDCTNGRMISNMTNILATNQPDLNLDNNQTGIQITVTSVIPCHIYLPIILKEYPSPPCHTETFDDSNSGWLVSPAPQLPKTFVEYYKGQYHMFTQDPSLLHWVTSPLGPYNNYSIQVDAKWANNTYIGTEYGFVFDLSDNSTMYRFNINTNNGMYILGRLQGSWITLVSNTSSDIFTGTITNTLKVKRNGSNIDLYINERYQTSYIDSTLPRPAYMGININPYDHIDGEAYFDNFIVCSYELNIANINSLEARPASGLASKP